MIILGITTKYGFSIKSHKKLFKNLTGKTMLNHKNNLLIRLTYPHNMKLKDVMKILFVLKYILIHYTLSHMEDCGALTGKLIK